MLANRVYKTIFKHHLSRERQMVFVTGPRQVGKTTTCRACGTDYLNWDDPEAQRVIAQGGKALADRLNLQLARASLPIVVLDEIHKYARWKNCLKGFFDMQAEHCRVIVTGSSRLDVYHRGGDSLMGRYFLYRMHPLSVGELIRTTLPSERLVHPPGKISETDWQALRTHGGFPEPFLRREASFTQRWVSLRLRQLTREDVRENSTIQRISLMEIMTQILSERSSCQLTYASLGREVGISPPTVVPWLNMLESLHFGFTVRPWFRSIANAIRKEPKWYLRDWSSIKDPGARNETMVACHLLKSVEGWTDLGLGEFALHYMRTKQQQEIDFVISRDGQPWCLVECKTSETRISDSLVTMAKRLSAPHAIQVVMDLPYEEVDCFSYKRPMVVPARTFLSQLM